MYSLISHFPFRGFISMGLVFDICQTEFKFSSLEAIWKFDIDENGSLNYHTTHKNDQNLLPKIVILEIMTCFARSDENVAIVSESVAEGQNVTIHRRL